MPLQPRILIAHFDPEQLAELARVARASGADVTTAKDGREALQAVTPQAPSLALVSTLLSGVNGFEVCRLWTREKRAAFPVVLLTDVEDPYVRARARHVGAARVVKEPLQAEDLAELLESTLTPVEPLDELTPREQRRGDRLMRELLDEEPAERPPGILAGLTDALTGLVTEDYFRLKTEEELKRSNRYGQPTSLLVAQIDNYDEIVSRFGRRAGDEALLEVAGVFLCESRDLDVGGRSAQARFLLLLPCTDLDGAHTLAQRVAESLAHRCLFLEEEEVPLQVSIAAVSETGETSDESVDSFFDRVSQALQDARQEGAQRPD